MAAITKVAYTVRAKIDYLLQSTLLVDTLFYITMTTTTITLSELHTCTLVIYFCRVCCRGGTGSFGSDAWLRYICPGLNLSSHSGGSRGNCNLLSPCPCAPWLWRGEDTSTLGEDLDIAERSLWRACRVVATMITKYRNIFAGHITE